MHPVLARLIATSLMLLLLSACSDTSRPAMPDALSIHRDAITIDAHADIELPGQPSSYVGADGLSKVSPAKMRSGGLDAVVMSVAVGPKPERLRAIVKRGRLPKPNLPQRNLLLRIRRTT